jgi:hypothetical protein
MVLERMNLAGPFLTHKLALFPNGSKLVICQPITSGETTVVIQGNWRDTKLELEAFEKARSNFLCIPDTKACFEETACAEWNPGHLYFAEKLRGGIQFSLPGLQCHGGHDLSLLTYEQLHAECCTEVASMYKPIRVVTEVFITALSQVKCSEMKKLPMLGKDENGGVVVLDRVVCNTLTMFYKLGNTLGHCLETQSWEDTGAASVIKASRDPTGALRSFQEQLLAWEAQAQSAAVMEEYYVAPVHGSLDGSNILTEGGFVWLVGLSQAHVGHVLEDVARLMCATLFVYTPLQTERHWQLALRMGFEISKLTDLSAPDLVSTQKLGADRYPHMQLAWEVLHNCLKFVRCFVKGDGRPNQLLIPMLKFALEFMNNLHDEGIDVGDLYEQDPVRYYQYHWALDASVIWGKAIMKNLGIGGDTPAVQNEDAKVLDPFAKAKKTTKWGKDLKKEGRLVMERERCIAMSDFVETKERYRSHIKREFGLCRDLVMHRQCHRHMYYLPGRAVSVVLKEGEKAPEGNALELVKSFLQDSLGVDQMVQFTMVGKLVEATIHKVQIGGFADVRLPARLSCQKMELAPSELHYHYDPSNPDEIPTPKVLFPAFGHVYTGKPAEEAEKDEWAAYTPRTFTQISRVECAGVLARVRAKVARPVWEGIVPGMRGHTRRLEEGQSIQIKLPISAALLPARVVQATEVCAEPLEMEYTVHLTQYGEVQLTNEKYGTLLQSDTAAPVAFNLSLDVDLAKDKKNQATIDVRHCWDDCSKWKEVDTGNGYFNYENKQYPGYRLNMKSVKGVSVPSAGEGKKGAYGLDYSFKIESRAECSAFQLKCKMGGMLQLQEAAAGKVTGGGRDSFLEWTKDETDEEGYFHLKSATPRYYATQKHINGNGENDHRRDPSCVWVQVGAGNEYFFLQNKDNGYRLKCQTATIDEHAGQIVPITPKTPATATNVGALKKTFSFRDESIANAASGRSRRYAAVGPSDAVGTEYQWTWEKVPQPKAALADPMAAGSSEQQWMLVSRYAKENPGPSMKPVSKQRNDQGDEQQQQVWISPVGEIYGDPVDANYWIKTEIDAEVLPVEEEEEEEEAAPETAPVKKTAETSLGHTVVLDAPTVLGLYDYTSKDAITVLELNPDMIAGFMAMTTTGAQVTMQGQPTLVGLQPAPAAHDAVAAGAPWIVTEDEAVLLQAVVKEEVRSREQQIEVWAKFLVLPGEELDEELMAKRRKAEVARKAREDAAGEDGSRASLVAKAKEKLTPGLEKMGLEWAGVAEMLEGDSVSLDQLKQAIENPDSFFQNFAQAAGGLEDDDEQSEEARAEAAAQKAEETAVAKEKADAEAKLQAQVAALADARLAKAVVLVIPEYCCVDRQLLTAQPVLLSGQGMCGKTMLAKQLVLTLAKEPGQLGGAEVLPILVDAADLAKQHQRMRAARIKEGVQEDHEDELARLAPIEPAVVMAEYLKQVLPPMRYHLIASIFIDTELQGKSAEKKKRMGGIASLIPGVSKNKSKSILLVVDGLDRLGKEADEGTVENGAENGEGNFRERVEAWLCEDLCHRVKLVVTMRGNADRDSTKKKLDDSYPEEDAWLYEGEGNERKQPTQEDPEEDPDGLGRFCFFNHVSIVSPSAEQQKQLMISSGKAAAAALGTAFGDMEKDAWANWVQNEAHELLRRPDCEFEAFKASAITLSMLFSTCMWKIGRVRQVQQKRLQEAAESTAASALKAGVGDGVVEDVCFAVGDTVAVEEIGKLTPVDVFTMYLNAAIAEVDNTEAIMPSHSWSGKKYHASKKSKENLAKRSGQSTSATHMQREATHMQWEGSTAQQVGHEVVCDMLGRIAWWMQDEEENALRERGEIREMKNALLKEADKQHGRIMKRTGACQRLRESMADDVKGTAKYSESEARLEQLERELKADKIKQRQSVELNEDQLNEWRRLEFDRRDRLTRVRMQQFTERDVARALHSFELVAWKQLVTDHVKYGRMQMLAWFPADPKANNGEVYQFIHPAWQGCFCANKIISDIKQATHQRDRREEKEDEHQTVYKNKKDEPEDEVENVVRTLTSMICPDNVDQLFAATRHHRVVQMLCVLIRHDQVRVEAEKKEKADQARKKRRQLEDLEKEEAARVEKLGVRGVKNALAEKEGDAPRRKRKAHLATPLLLSNSLLHVDEKAHEKLTIDAHIGVSAAGMLAALTQGNKMIRFLNLSEATLSVQAANSLAEGVKSSPLLKSLTLHKCPLPVQELIKPMDSLNMSNKHLNALDAVVILKLLELQRTVKSLWLNDNDLGDHGAEYLGPIIRASSLTSIDLSQNGIGVNGAKQMLSSGLYESEELIRFCGVPLDALRGQRDALAKSRLWASSAPAREGAAAAARAAMKDAILGYDMAYFHIKRETERRFFTEGKMMPGEQGEIAKKALKTCEVEALAKEKRESKRARFEGNLSLAVQKIEVDRVKRWTDLDVSGEDMGVVGVTVLLHFLEKAELIGSLHAVRMANVQLCDKRKMDNGTWCGTYSPDAFRAVLDSIDVKGCTITDLDLSENVIGVEGAAVLAEKLLAEPQLPDGWTEVKDEESGGSYYYCPTTEETTWDRPKLPMGWARGYDGDSKKEYFYEESTGETLWERPVLPGIANSLQVLDLSGSWLTGEAVQGGTLSAGDGAPSSTQKWAANLDYRGLYQLGLALASDECKMKTIRLAHAPLPISELKNTKDELDMSYKELNFEDVFVIIQLVKSSPTLEILDLSGNPIGNEGIQVIAESLEVLQLKGIKCYEMNIQFDATLRNIQKIAEAKGINWSFNKTSRW